MLWEFRGKIVSAKRDEDTLCEDVIYLCRLLEEFYTTGWLTPLGKGTAY